MRHQRFGRKLKRTSSHRKATLSALCTSLILHKKIKTTVAKAKEARMFAEKLITRAKNAVAKETDPSKKDISARREVFDYLRNRQAVSILFKDIATKVNSRQGGYTRVVKLGRRLGDAAELALLELVDFNIAQEKAAAKSKKKAVSRKKGESKEEPKEKKDQPVVNVPEPAEKKPAENVQKENIESPASAKTKKKATKKESK
jgi:large subunit ribosomal protein L17